MDVLQNLQTEVVQATGCDWLQLGYLGANQLQRHQVERCDLLELGFFEALAIREGEVFQLEHVSQRIVVQDAGALEFQRRNEADTRLDVLVEVVQLCKFV